MTAPACMVCGGSDRLLRQVGGSHLCVNTERCDTDIQLQKAERILAELRNLGWDPKIMQAERRAQLSRPR